MGTQIVDYLDEDGIPRRVLVPQDVDVSEGIRLSADIDRLYKECPVDFRRRLVLELNAVGLIEPKDFLGHDASTRVRAALQQAIKSDTMSILAFAKEQSDAIRG